MKDTFRVPSDTNRPKFYFNFIGPESDDHIYCPDFPETELSLSLAAAAAGDNDAGDGASRECNLLGVMERAGIEQGRGMGVYIRKDKQVMREENEVGPARVPVLGLKRRAEDNPTRIVELNPVVIGSVTGQPAPPADGKAPALGEGTSNEKREIVLDFSKAKSGDVASSPTNSNAKKMKATAAENDDVFITLPKRKPDPTAAGSGSGSGSGSRSNGDVLLKGYLHKNTIMCLCHGHAYSPEEFAKHVGPNPRCFVTVPRSDCNEVSVREQ